MGYKMDIPTLSVNEVYTLTFEYEGEDTIQLTVGDLTLETTDRRVVFTTTSPVNYIESNVKLENLDLYEGYYESDDQDGEYIQESYIEGKTEIIDNVMKCVKSPKIVSKEEPNNLLHMKEWSSTLSGGTAHSKDGKIYFSGLFTTMAYFDLLNGGERKNNCYFEAGTYHLTSHLKSLSPARNDEMHFGIGYTLEDGTSGQMILSTKIGGMVDEVYTRIIEATTPIVELYLNVLSFSFSDTDDDDKSYLYIDGISLSKDQAVSPNSNYSVVTTPNDLELYGWKDSKGTWVKDKLDLTTGTYYQYYDMWDLATLLSQTKPQSGFSYNADIGMVSVQWNLGYTHPSGTVWKGQGGFSALIGDYFEYGYGNTNLQQKTSPYIGFFNQYLYFGGMSYSEIFNGVTITNDGTRLDTNEATSALIKFVTDNNLRIGLPLNTPKTKQLDIKPLKSYRNGSITTSSQQLAPTLITTLPVSNKFTQTNLTTGSTYNIHFDGTATSLNCGGTIVDSPTSPCQVRCGDTTTLTIEGEVSNVKVLETSVQNEVGSVVGTTDVELTKLVTAKYENLAENFKIIESRNVGIIENEDDSITITATTLGSTSWAKVEIGTGELYPQGVSLVHVEFDIDMPEDNLMAIVYLHNNVRRTSYDYRCLKLTNDTASICQGMEESKIYFANYVTKGHFSKLLYVDNTTNKKMMQFRIGVGASNCNPTDYVVTDTYAKEGDVGAYTVCGAKGMTISNIRMRIIEHHPSATSLSDVTSSLRTNNGQTVIWKDMGMQMSQKVCDLETPIKLRSLGNIYDSYDLVTGILTKRIGVSETDGSYTALSSPIKSEVPAGQPFTNIITSTFPVKFSSFRDFAGDFKQNTTYTIFLDVAIVTGSPQVGILRNGSSWAGGSPISYNVGLNKFVLKTDSSSKLALRVRGTSVTLNGIVVLEGDYMHFDFIKYFEGRKYIHEIPQLYKDGQIKVYSDSDIYPTTVISGQSTNNYVVKHLNTSANYTIRYEGNSESVTFGGNPYTATSNIVIKSGGLNDSLTFDNSSVDKVMLFEGDVTEQDIFYSNGRQLVEFEGLLIQNGSNLFNANNCEKYTGSNNDDVITIDFIPAIPNETIYCNYTQGTNAYSWLIEYDENMVQTRRTEYCGQGYSRKAITLQANTQYIKITARRIYTSQVMINRGNDYLPYEAPVSPYKITHFQLPQSMPLNKIHKESGMGYDFWYDTLNTHVDPTVGTVWDSYNPITGKYIQRIGVYHMCGADSENYIDNLSETMYVIDDNSLPLPRKRPYKDVHSASLIDVDGIPYTTSAGFNDKDIVVSWMNLDNIGINLPREHTGSVFGKDALKQWLRENPITLYYELETPIVTQLDPIQIPIFENGKCYLMTKGGALFPILEYSLPTTNRYSTSMWNVGSPITQRNATEIYIDGSTTPTTPTETMTFTKEQLSSGSIVINDNGDGLMVLNGDYTGRDIPYFTGMRSVESIEIETTGSSDQPLFGKGGRR